MKVKNIETRNSHLEGKPHPETGVPYERKIVENADGNKVNGVFPDFNVYRQFEVTLPENLLKETDKNQAEFCNKKLKEAYDKGTINVDNFSKRQLEQIKDGEKPQGFTWHHNEEKGRMELVKADIHQATGHTGGKSIWGGGKEAR